MSSPQPIHFLCYDGMLTPINHHRELFKKHFVNDEIYPMVVQEKRSTKSHSHFFASVTEAWKNLPEDIATDFPTPERLRKWALIKAHYCDVQSKVFPTPEIAREVAAFMRPMDEFSIVDVQDRTVTVYTAQSQSVRAMDAKTFQESKDKVLGIISDLIGVKKSELNENAGKSA